ncbi:MAG: gamma-glutamyl-gamma-aminobutyrate hydrolase family protein [Alloprevotella sp.]|nr:gamma-glutamyl-gamma-aminobutyrate hydrolase family protein [Prevotella sp.]MBR1712789.1 gamma-glutamyl-gamma-aminobutyrate hydrolase family protein [Alloprevotella sp.]
MNFDPISDYQAQTDHFPNHSCRPVIGITGNYGDKGCELAEGYWRSIEAAGGIPVALPPTDSPALLLSLLDRIDGLMLSGGADINPLYLGEEPLPALGNVNSRRDRGELLIVRLAYDRQIPILGICRGIQTLAAALGGSIHQDLASCLPEGTPLLKHSQEMARGAASHFIEAEEGSLVESLLGKRVAVNSFHHQAVREPGPLLRATAYAADGVIEAVESVEHKSVLGVQWHPECFILEGDKSMSPLFRWFVEECESYRRAVDTHNQVLTLDSHVDTPMFFDQGVRFDHRDPKVRVDMHKLTEGRMDAVVMAAYIKQEARTEEGLGLAQEKCDRLLYEIQEMVNGVRGAQLAYTPKDAFRLKAIGKKAVFLGVENGYAIGKDLARIEDLRRIGVTYMTLCHNGDNDICDSAMRSEKEWGGLSPFGREVVREMNRVGMMVDLSHAAESSFYDAIAESVSPVVCSHSSSRACCDHPRNLTDDQLRALADCGGVAQVTFYPSFLREDGAATIDDAVRHLMHMIEVAGIDHVGVGSDFDGDGGVPGLNSEAEMLNLTRRMIAEGLNTSQIRKIWGGNFIRVMSQTQYKGEVKL